MEIERLAFIHENYFVGSIFGAKEEPFREVAFYYLMKQCAAMFFIKQRKNPCPNFHMHSE